MPSDLFSADHDVEMYRVTYPMPYLGDTVNVSGALFVPMGFEEPCGLPIHVYMHGTLFKRTDGVLEAWPRSLGMHPNPASDQVRLAGGDASTSWRVVSVATGQVVRSGQGETVHLESLSAGMWLVQADGLGRGLLSVTR